MNDEHEHPSFEDTDEFENFDDVDSTTVEPEDDYKEPEA